jgi:hypothetical protein
MENGRNTRKSVKSIKMPRGLTSFQKGQYLRNATRRARVNAHRRGTPFIQGSVRLPIDELKSVNRHLNALLSAYEDEQDSGRYGDVIDTISMIFVEISSDILRIKANLPNLHSSKYPELSSDSEEHIFERMEELARYNRSVIIRGGDNELAKKILRIIRKAFFAHRVPNSANMNSSNSNNSNSNNSNSNNSTPAVKDELDALMGALSAMRF